MQTKRISRNLFALLILLLLAAAVCFTLDFFQPKDMAFVKKMNPGFNLGNTLDAHGLNDPSAGPEQYETYWGNPITTKEMISAVKQAGFNTLRVPVTWYEHMNADHRVDGVWMDRVQQVVDDGIESGLFVIINAHHDAWYTPSEENRENAVKIMRLLWEQISDRFADYGENLLFEGMNEPRLIGTENEWDEGTKPARETVNLLNKAFVETVRLSGGKNRQRYLLLPAYCAGTKTDTLQALCLHDTSRIIVSMHLYRPYGFALDEAGTPDWDANSNADTAEIDQAVGDAARMFTGKGVPVIITEFGAYDKANTKARADWARYIMGKASQSNIPCIWWDDSIFDRRTLQWRYPEILKALTGKP